MREINDSARMCEEIRRQRIKSSRQVSITNFLGLRRKTFRRMKMATAL
jgi:hypothetical protein